MDNIFWQANFWGIVGTASGALGLVVSWLNWRYSKPKIDIVRLELETPWLVDVKTCASQPKREEYWLEFTLHVRFRNKKGGPGSIEKPLLILKYKTGYKLKFIPQFKQYILKPRTKHTEWKKESENFSTGRTIRHGEAWNFTGGQTIDDELEYTFNNSEFYDFALNWDRVEYSIEYFNNFGRRFRKRILHIREPNRN